MQLDFLVNVKGEPIPIDFIGFTDTLDRDLAMIGIYNDIPQLPRAEVDDG